MTAYLFPAIAWSIVVALLGVILGLFASLELDLLPGSSIVLALTVLFAIAPLVARVTKARA